MTAKFKVLAAGILVSINCHAQFDEPKVIATKPAVGIQRIELCDVDGDGLQDLLTASKFDDRVGWCANLGNGEFAPRIDISNSLDYASNAKAGDFDGDGDLDVVAVGIVNDRVSVFENLGNGNFGLEQVIDASADDPYDILIFDVDGDSDLDIMVSHSGADEIRWYPNSGGVFGLPNLFATGNNIRNLGRFDLDNDADLDILSISNTYDVAIHENVNGTYLAPSTIISSPYFIPSFEVHDFDNDGLLDIAIIESVNVNWSKNLGNNNFQSTQLLTSLFDNPELIRLADMDGDNDIDLVGIGNFPEEIKWLENTGSPNFTIEHPLGTNLYSSSQLDMILADIDGVNGMDILWSESEDDFVELRRNLGGGVMDSPERLTGMVSISNPIVVDVNNDGLPDIVSANDSQHLVWIENLGGNNYGPTRPLTPNTLGGMRLFAGDMNNDGFTDIAYFNAASDDVYWISNNGNGSFSLPQLLDGSMSAVTSFDLGDSDNDGDMDLLMASSSPSEQTEWFENLGGSFASGVIIPNVNWDEKYAQFGNINGDILPDVVIATASNVVWCQNFNGSTTNVSVITTGNFKMVSCGDLDGDGDDDIVCVNTSDQIYSIENLGGGNFASLVPVSSSISGLNRIQLEDVDNDGDLDLVASSYWDYKVSWHENIAGILSPEVVLSLQNFQGPEGFFVGDTDLDGDNDLLINRTIPSSLSTELTVHTNGVFDAYQAKGKVFVDENQNGVLDGNESGFNVVSVNSSPAASVAYTALNGDYFLNFGGPSPTSYIIAPNNLTNWIITSDSLTYTVLLDSSTVFMDSLDFGVYPSAFIDSTHAELTGAFPRCNNVINGWIDVSNKGTTLPSGVIELQLDPQLTYVSASVTPDSIIGQTVYWSYDSIFYNQSEFITYQVLTPDFQSIGDSLKSSLNVYTLDNLGNVIFESNDSICQILVCAYDPNDKIADVTGVGVEGFIPVSTDYLDYTIRFQNTGNDTAVHVIIEDQLDSNLDWLSIQPLGASHNMTLGYDPNGLLSFEFDSIMLPDSNVNFLGSQGFVKFRIHLIQGLSVNTEITNSAAIFFDQNPPIITNTKLHTIYDCNSLNLSINNPLVCFGDTIIMSSQNINNTSQTWQISGVLTSSTDSLIWVTDTSGVFNVQLSSTNNFCSQDTAVGIEVLPFIPVTPVTLSICEGDSALINGTYENLTGTYVELYPSIIGCDSLVEISLSVLPIDTTITNVTFCPGDSVLIGGNYISTPGIYYETYSSIAGCDSMVEINLNLSNPFNTTVSSSDPILEALLPNASYQWLDCNLNFSPIIGETNQTFVASYNSQFAVELTLSGCVDTSACVSVVTAGVNENNLTRLFNIYPNPSDGNIIVEMGKKYDWVEAEVISLNGRLIQHDEFINSERFELNIISDAGLYLLKIWTEEGTSTKRLVIH